jgi:zinc resistance-associated protein
MKATKKILAGILTFALLGTAGLAFAHGSWGRGPIHDGYGRGYGHMMMGGGYGHMMGPGGSMGYGRGWSANLTYDQREELAASRNAFFQATEGLRDQVYQKGDELTRELDRHNPDAAKVKSLQKALSGLEAEFDQKRLAHQLELKKIAPELGRGLGGRGMGGNLGGFCMR